MHLPPPPSYPPEFGNAQYDNRRRVADWQRYLVRWQAQAAEARAALPGRLDLPYHDDPATRLDLFGPHDRKARPLLVFLHGGYWRSLSKSDFSWIAAPYVAVGLRVAVVDYGLVPHVTLETVVQHNLAAVAWLWRHARDLHVRPGRIVVAGHSAGGHLTAMMLAARWRALDRRLPDDVVHAGVAISGLYDMEPLRHTPYLNADLQLTLDRVAPLSPLYMRPATDAPLITAVGGDESDEFKRHDREIGMAWSSVLMEDVPMPGDDHFSACERLAEPGHRLFEATVELFG